MKRKHRAPFLADGLWRCTVNRCSEYVTVGEVYRVATADSASASRSVDFRRADGAGTYANERMVRVFVRQGRLAFERVRCGSCDRVLDKCSATYEHCCTDEIAALGLAS